MTYDASNHGTLPLRFGGSVVRLRYRRPAPAELITALARKAPTDDEEADAIRIITTNLELGAECIEGIDPGGLVIGGEDVAEMDDWRHVVRERAPLLLIALGQHLSAVPGFIEETESKKSWGMPAA